MAQPQDYRTTIYLDPQHIFCNNGMTFLTCRSCAGNPPREFECKDCNGNGFNTYICDHCQNVSVPDQARIRLFTPGPLAAGSPNLKSLRSSSPEGSINSSGHPPTPRNLGSP
ncbi:hypothetical protein MGYG_02576 [Nannizzia gypsea CBS 118893]|uniref:Uncharacterized protein n=1 Tax=Arthroderma gypseum (strain ATCC MYA-4604 / CBS 118893) TaxID=535722 RepID=E4UNA3_ARTGP|nr:hypothetical protein MGYG_02576 [Nannizzia gypsea CBS 118893]EFQ99564.1 hypothetical protein MGYG_02576 [Nannizzia gypsea CBS 118893]